MARYHGSRGQIKLDPTGGATAVTVASLNSWTLDQARDKVDVTAFGDNFKQYVQGLPDVKGTIGGWFDETETDLFDVAAGDIAATLELIPSTLIPTHLFKGPAFLDASIAVSATGAVSITSNFVGAGDWTREPAGALGRRRREGEPREGGNGGSTGPIPRRH